MKSIKYKTKKRNNTKTKTNRNKTKLKYKTKTKITRKRKGGAPYRLSVRSLTELAQQIRNLPNDSRIWIVKNGENNALYESNKNDLLESLFDKGITNENIKDYDFNIL